MKKKFTGMLVLASTLALAACSNNTNSETIATTKYGNVTREEFVNAMKDTVGEQTLQRLVLTKVLEGSVEDSKKLKEDPLAVVINAGTPGIVFNRKLREQIGHQFVDVGIAEEQAVTMTTGLAKNGAKPVWAVLSTFLQRTYDQLSHDMALNNQAGVVLVYSASINSMNDESHLGFFDIPVDHLMGAPLIADYFERRGMTGSDYVVVSPDHGGVTRARKLAEFLKTPIAIIDKRRSVDKMNTSEVMNIIGKVEGKTCILIDDMIDTAGTICHAADALAEAGAVEVYASCTHPVLSGPAMQNIQKSAIKKLVVLDTIYLPEERLIDKIEQISIAHLLAEAIVRIHEKRPLSPLFETLTAL